MPEPGSNGDAPRRRSSPQRLADRSLSVPHPGRLSPNNPAYPQVIAAHDAALRAGADTYLDPASGLTVLTAAFLASRGYCCESGCRHCPYVE